jgi:hypothetical protein
MRLYWLKKTVVFLILLSYAHIRANLIIKNTQNASELVLNTNKNEINDVIFRNNFGKDFVLLKSNQQVLNI